MTLLSMSFIQQGVPIRAKIPARTPTGETIESSVETGTNTSDTVNVSHNSLEDETIGREQADTVSVLASTLNLKEANADTTPSPSSASTLNLQK
jgi:hypothetical protein